MAAVSKDAPASDVEVRVGQPAPELDLEADDGRRVRLADLRGKKVVLYFYPKDDTPGCTKEACDFRDRSKEVTERGALVFGISADSPESHRKFKAKYKLNFPLLSDPDKRVLRAYGVWKSKSMYGRIFPGIVRTTVVIDERGTIAKLYPKVKVVGHADEVLAQLA